MCMCHTIACSVMLSLSADYTTACTCAYADLVSHEFHTTAYHANDATMNNVHVYSHTCTCTCIAITYNQSLDYYYCSESSQLITLCIHYESLINHVLI